MVAQISKWTMRHLESLAVARRTDFVDPDTSGLLLRVTPTGTKTWSVLYNRKSDGKKRRVTLGDFRSLSLAAARAKALQIRHEVWSGKDPAGTVAEYKRAESVGQLLDEFIKKHPRPDAIWTRECKRIFDKDVCPLIGDVKLPDLSRVHVRAVIEAVQSRGVTTTVNRTLAALRRALTWAVSKDLLATNPALNLATDIIEEAKDRALSADEIAKFWRGLDGVPMGLKSKLALKIILVTGQRPGEVCGVEKSEVDLISMTWTIPSRRSKNRQTHVVPVSRLAADLFRQALEVSGDSDFVFSSRPRQGLGLGLTRSMQAHALSHAMRNALPALGLAGYPATPHDLRRTVATHMALIGVADRIVGRVLNHGTELRRTITSRVYIQHDYRLEKTQALEAWARELERLIESEAPRPTVLELRASA
jgi:integrase